MDPYIAYQVCVIVNGTNHYNKVYYVIRMYVESLLAMSTVDADYWLSCFCYVFFWFLYCMNLTP